MHNREGSSDVREAWREGEWDRNQGVGKMIEGVGLAGQGREGKGYELLLSHDLTRCQMVSVCHNPLDTPK